MATPQRPRRVARSGVVPRVQQEPGEPGDPGELRQGWAAGAAGAAWAAWAAAPASRARGARCRVRHPPPEAVAGRATRAARHRSGPTWCRAMARRQVRSEEHTSELQSRGQLVCRLLLEKKKIAARCNIGQNVLISRADKNGV